MDKKNVINYFAHSCVYHISVCKEVQCVKIHLSGQTGGSAEFIHPETLMPHALSTAVSGEFYHHDHDNITWLKTYSL